VSGKSGQPSDEEPPEATNPNNNGAGQDTLVDCRETAVAAYKCPFGVKDCGKDAEYCVQCDIDYQRFPDLPKRRQVAPASLLFVSGDLCWFFREQHGVASLRSNIDRFVPARRLYLSAPSPVFNAARARPGVLLPYWLNLRSVRELFRRDQAALPNQLKMRSATAGSSVSFSLQHSSAGI
jgi:hypothetical protein